MYHWMKTKETCIKRQNKTKIKTEKIMCARVTVTRNLEQWGTDLEKLSEPSLQHRQNRKLWNCLAGTDSKLCMSIDWWTVGNLSRLKEIRWMMGQLGGEKTVTWCSDREDKNNEETKQRGLVVYRRGTSTLEVGESCLNVDFLYVDN